jgi:zinc transporter 7
MAFFAPRRVAFLLLVAVAFVYAEKHAASIASMSIPEIEDKLQVRQPKLESSAQHETH